MLLEMIDPHAGVDEDLFVLARNRTLTSLYARPANMRPRPAIPRDANRQYAARISWASG